MRRIVILLYRQSIKGKAPQFIMANHFTHLHLHTDYSLLDGAIAVDKLIPFAKQHDFKALAITDHGNIFGAVKFFQQCKKAGIKPVLGMEAYLTEDASIKDSQNRYYHLILLVQNAEGYKNLCKLISFSYQQGFYFKPRIDYQMLEKHSKGLIATSGCLGGHIPSLLMNGEDEKARERLDYFKNLFGPERFYLEVQPEDLPKQAILNQKIFALSAATGTPLVATGDCHYLDASDHEAHEIMLSIQTHDKIDNPNRYTFGDCRVYVRTAQEMLAIFKDHEDAVWNSGKIADSCEFDFETGKLFFPKFAIPDNQKEDDYFAYLCRKGLQERVDQGYFPISDLARYQERLELEIDLITKMGFVGYFLVVSDFIQWAYRTGIPVGPGRGSAAGSLVAWSLLITNIDPLKYNLLFERFLNPERVTMPDIDIDFCIEGREEVINYIRERYGHDKVCHIITFGTMMAKGVIKDVARVLGLAFEDSNAITNLIPEQLKITLEESLEQEPRLKELVENSPRVKKIFDVALRLEGLTRHASKHAAGIVISPAPIDEVLPVYVPAKSDELVAQYAMTELESIGFLKIDLLGLKNLTLIKRVVTLIKKNHGIDIDISKIALDDEKTFALLCAGNTSGVFQLESSGLKDVLRKLQPEKFEDIIAVNALYRPGPLGSGMVDDFIQRRHGRAPIVYIFPELEPVLQETYGVIVYQEQVMKIATAIAGYSLGESDILRRAMGKKKAEVMAEQREIFTQKAIARSFDAQKAGELFDLMAYFAGYGFNKSHSAAYALIAYQTAYLKAHFPAEFMACLISLEVDAPDTMTNYLEEAKSMGLRIISPTINDSEQAFSVIKEDEILFGLRGIKNVGSIAIENIIAERTKKPFTDFFEFCQRVDLRTVNKRVIESLICAGAFDQLPGHRSQKFHELATIIDKAIAEKNDKKTGQMGLFSAARSSADPDAVQAYQFEMRDEWSNKEKLEREKEVASVYISAHPLESYRDQLTWLSVRPFAQIAQDGANNEESLFVGAGFVKTRKDITTKKGDRMAFLQLEDMQSSIEVIVFPKLFLQVEQWLNNYHIFVVKGVVDSLSSQPKIKASQLIPLDLFWDDEKLINRITITLPNFFDYQSLQKAKEMVHTGAAILEFIYQEDDKNLRIVCKNRYAARKEFISFFHQHGASISLEF